MGVQHIVIEGKTGSGKSFFGMKLLQRFYNNNWNIVFIDVGHSIHTYAKWYEGGTLERPKLYNGTLDTRNRVTYYVPTIPAWKDSTLADLYQQCLHTSYTVVYHDEIIGIATDSQYPVGLVQVYSQGRKNNVVGIICTQRPVSIPRICLSQSGIVVAFRTVDTDDIKVIARRINRPDITSSNAWLVPYDFYLYNEEKMDSGEYRSPLSTTKRGAIEHGKRTGLARRA